MNSYDREIQWTVWLTLVVLLVLSVALAIAIPPPMPPTPKRHKPITAGTKGATLLISKQLGAVKSLVIIPPRGMTNDLAWKYGVISSNYWWNLQCSINLRTWTTIQSNVALGNCSVTNGLSPGAWFYRLEGRLNP